jgi:hypothetical protein
MIDVPQMEPFGNSTVSLFAETRAVRPMGHKPEISGDKS